MSDNSWYEKGELPPVDKQCMNGDSIVQIVAHLFNGEHKYAAFQNIDGKGCGYSGAEYFRPIKTERELAIEEMAKVMSKGTVGTYMSVAEKLYDAGYRKNES